MRFAHALIAVSISTLTVACYKCVDPQCSNLPPVQPNYPANGQPLDVFPDGSEEAAKSPCGKACTNLKAIACPEGISPSCYRACLRQASLERIAVTCWSSAHSQPEARACGGVRCVP